MNEHSKISKALISVLGELDVTQDQLAREMEISQAGVSKIIAGKTRPARPTMRVLFGALKTWSYPHAVRVLMGHLEDEILASGMLLSDIELHPARDKPPAREDIEQNLDIIRTGAIRVEETALLVKDLAWLIDHAEFKSDGTS